MPKRSTRSARRADATESGPAGPRRDPRKTVLAGLSLVLGLAFAGLVAEAGLRTFGHDPFEQSPQPATAFLAPDATLGWKPVPGVYRIRYSDRAEPVPVTILRDRTRAASRSRADAPETLILGGSHAFGFALSDSESLPWLLQEHDCQRRYVNAAVAAYGGAQSLAVLEERLEQRRAPRTVVYAYSAGHDVSDTAYQPDPSYSRAVRRAALLPRTGQSAAGGNQYPGRTGAPLPWRERFAMVHALDRSWSALRTRVRLTRRDEVRDRLFADMRAACEQAGAQFAVLLIDTDAGTEVVEESLARLSIPYLDLRVHAPPNLLLPGADRRPNGKLTRIWADEAAPFLRALYRD